MRVGYSIEVGSIVVALAMVSAVALGQSTKTPNITMGSAPAATNGIKVVEPGVTPVAQVVIPRFANGKTAPAGQIVGSGAQSVLAGTAQTEKQVVPAVVITQDYDAVAMSEWQGGTYEHPEHAAAVLQPVVRDVTIAGFDDHASEYTSGEGAVRDPPNEHDLGKPDKYGGLFFRAEGAQIENVSLFYIPGTAAVFRRDGNPRNGEARMFDRAMTNVRRLNVNRVYRGVDCSSVDMHVDDLEVWNFRDWGVKLGGAVQFGRLHTYGGGNTSDMKEHPENGAGVWFAGDVNQGGPIYAESGPIGAYFSSAHNALTGYYAHSCTEAGARLDGAFNRIVNFRVKAGVLGFLVAGQYNTLSTGNIELTTGATGIRITNGSGQILRDVTINMHGLTDTTGIEAAAQLNSRTWNVTLAGGKVGVDLKADDGTSRLGVNNTIYVTIAGQAPATPIDLPKTSWRAGNNHVFLNGNEVKSP